MENNKIIDKVKDKISISNFEMEERIIMNKRKKILSITSAVVICLVCSFGVVNAATGNTVVNHIEKTINKIFNKENITMDYGEKTITVNAKDDFKIDSDKVMEIKHSHNGIDLKAEYGEDVLSIASGEVIEAKYEMEMGNYIIIKHNEGDFAYTKYAHLSNINVEVGDIVEKNTKIGEAGKTGRVTGTCLHFEILDKDMNPIDPTQFLD